MGVIVRQSIKGTIVNYIGAVIGALSYFFIATSLLTEEEIGLTRTLFDAAALLAMFAQLGITRTAIRFFPYFKSADGKNNGFFFYMMIVPLIGCLITLPLYYLFKHSIANYFIDNSTLFVDYIDWIIPLMLFIVYLEVFETYSNLFMRIAIPKAIREIGIRTMIIVTYLLYGFGVINLTGFVAAYVAVYGVAMVLNFYYSSRIGTISLKHNLSFITPDLRKKILQYMAFLVAGVVGSAITLKLDIFMLGGKVGLDSTGIYTIALQIAIMVELPSRSLSAISTPVASEHMKNGDLKEGSALYKKVALNQLLIGGFIFLLIWINVDNIFAIMPNGDSYAAGKWSIFFLSLSRLIVVFLGFGGVLLSFSRYYYWSLYFSVFITILSILTNNWLIPIYGMTGAALATLITVLFVHIIQQWFVVVKLKGNPYSLNCLKVCLILIGLFGLNWLLPNLINPWLDACYRTVIIGGVGGVVFYFTKVSNDINILINRMLLLFNKNEKE